MAASIYDFDTTAANNTTVDGISQAENVMRPPAVNNAFRALDAILARFCDDLGAVNTVGGTGDAVTVTLASGITAYATGQLFRFIAGAANTGAATMNVNSIGAKAIRKISGGTDVALSAGDIAAGETYLVIYRASANGAAGAWVLVGSSGSYLALTGGTLTGDLTLTSTDAGAGAGPITDYYRNSASPAASDLLGLIPFNGNDSGGNKTRYAYINGTIVDPTNGSEDGALVLATTIAGAEGVRAYVGAGIYTGSATGGDKGADTINVSNYYRNGTLANPGMVLLTSGSVSSAATLDIVLTSYTGYRGIRVVLSNLLPATDAVQFYMRTSTNGGSSYDAGGSDYTFETYQVNAGAGAVQSGTAAQIQLARFVGNVAGSEGVTTIIDFFDQTAAANLKVIWQAWDGNDNGTMSSFTGAARRNSSADVDAIRFLFSSGNIASGNYAVYGYL